MNKSLLITSLLSFVFIGNACAIDMGVSADIGTTGFGAHLTVPVQESLNARFGFNTLNYNYSGSTSDTDYDFKLKLKTFDALLDYYPTSSTFRLTGGLVYNGNKVTAVAKPTAGQFYEFEGNQYDATQAGQINGNIDFKKVAPYLGIGFGNAVAKDSGWGFSGDLGVIFSGSAKSSLTNSGCNLTTLQCTSLNNDLQAENVRLQDELDNLRYYPVARIGISYKF